VSDDSTAQFMAGLYQLVENRGITYSQAINEMKRAFVRRQVLMEASDLTRGVQIIIEGKGKTGKWSHPFYWAPFVYYGMN
jgi:CHAT domain-containing protein